MARADTPFPLGIGSECDVVADPLPREQRVLLEYHATIGTGADDRISVNPGPSGGRANIAGNRVEQRGFAAARGTEQAHERAGADIDGRVFERVNGLAAAAKPYRYVPDGGGRVEGPQFFQHVVELALDLVQAAQDQGETVVGSHDFTASEEEAPAGGMGGMPGRGRSQ